MISWSYVASPLISQSLWSYHRCWYHGFEILLWQCEGEHPKNILLTPVSPVFLWKAATGRKLFFIRVNYTLNSILDITLPIASTLLAFDHHVLVFEPTFLVVDGNVHSYLSSALLYFDPVQFQWRVVRSWYDISIAWLSSWFITSWFSETFTVDGAIQIWDRFLCQFAVCGVLIEGLTSSWQGNINKYPSRDLRREFVDGFAIFVHLL